MMPRMRVLEPGLLLAHGNRIWDFSFCAVATVSLGLFSGLVSPFYFCTWALAWFSHNIYPIEARTILPMAFSACVVSFSVVYVLDPWL